MITIYEWNISYVELVGYMASLAVLLSFVMKNIKKLRIVNTFGCILFVIYGFLLKTSWPVIITNFAIICINVYYLLKESKKEN
jgi:uncharacterized protein with PQ loop repeat